jgi:hypothetical protein
LLRELAIDLAIAGNTITELRGPILLGSRWQHCDLPPECAVSLFREHSAMPIVPVDEHGNLGLWKHDIRLPGESLIFSKP